MLSYLAAFKAPRNGGCMGSAVEAATGSESFSNLVCKGFKPMLVCSKPVGGIKGTGAMCRDNPRCCPDFEEVTARKDTKNEPYRTKHK